MHKTGVRKTENVILSGDLPPFAKGRWHALARDGGIAF